MQRIWYRLPAVRADSTDMADLNVLALVKGTERFVFVYDDASRELMLDAVRDAAADPRLSLTWYDAALLVERAKRQTADPAVADS